MSRLVDEKQLEMQVKEIDRLINEKVARGNQIQQEMENINKELQNLNGQKQGIQKVISLAIKAEKYE